MKRAAVIVLVVLLTSDLLDETSTEPQLRFLFPHPWEVVRELGQVVLSLSLTFPHCLSPSHRYIHLYLNLKPTHHSFSLCLSKGLHIKVDASDFISEWLGNGCRLSLLANGTCTLSNNNTRQYAW